jgi:hypothetical protein
MTRSVRSRVTQEKSEREVASLSPEDTTKPGENGAMVLFEGEMGRSPERASDENVLHPHMPTAYVLVFSLTCLIYRYINLGGGGNIFQEWDECSQQDKHRLLPG